MNTTLQIADFTEFFDENGILCQVFDQKVFKLTKVGYFRSGKYGFIHRYVWQFYNGIIPKNNHIHHINGNPLDNRLINLELLTHSAHIALHNKDRGSKGLLPSQQPEFRLLLSERMTIINNLKAANKEMFVQSDDGRLAASLRARNTAKKGRLYSQSDEGKEAMSKRYKDMYALGKHPSQTVEGKAKLAALHANPPKRESICIICALEFEYKSMQIRKVCFNPVCKKTHRSSYIKNYRIAKKNLLTQ